MKNGKTARNTVTLTRVADGKKVAPPKVRTTPLRKIATSTAKAMTPPKVSGVYVQVAAFSQYQSALTTHKRINSYNSTIGTAINPRGDGSQLYKVLVGPFASTALAAKARSDLKQKSFPSAHLITWRS